MAHTDTVIISTVIYLLFVYSICCNLFIYFKIFFKILIEKYHKNVNNLLNIIMFGNNSVICNNQHT